MQVKIYWLLLVVLTLFFTGCGDKTYGAKNYYNLGCDHYDFGRYDEAIEAYKQAIRINPDDAQVHNNLGLTYYSDRSLQAGHSHRA
jgi:tetratricopeptide (TPR) repeat protein